MYSPEEPDSPISFTSLSSSIESLSDTYAFLNEKLGVTNHVRRIPLRHRAWWFLVLLTATGVFFANIVWSLSSQATRPVQTPSMLKDNDDEQIPIQANLDHFRKPEGLKLVALVSYTARSRTSILDCYLQANLAFNGGMLDQIIFVPETGNELDMDWLNALVKSTPGYYLLDKHPRQTGNVITGAPVAAQETTQTIISGHLTRSWNLAVSASQQQAEQSSSEKDDPPTVSETVRKSLQKQASTFYLFISAETVFLGPKAIPSLLQTHLAHPSYAFIHANIVNQPVLSWIHHHLGVVRPYRPETEPPLRVLKDTRNREETVELKAQFQHPWHSSTLPLWTATRSMTDVSQKEDEPRPQSEAPKDPPPSLFNVPIDFHPPFNGHRWLPYHPRLEKQDLPSQQFPIESPSQPTTTDTTPPSADPKEVLFSDSNSGSISTPVTQAMMSLSRPGKWPWTLSALHLYSFLEHLECEDAQANSPHPSPLKPTSSSDTHLPPPSHLDCPRIGGLSSYDMGLWQYQSEPYGLSLFLISASTIHQIGPLPDGVDEVAILRRAGGRGAAVDGAAVGVRFVGGGADEEVERRELETTDLLGRFRSVAKDEDVGRCGIFGD